MLHYVSSIRRHSCLCLCLWLFVFSNLYLLTQGPAGVGSGCLLYWLHQVNHKGWGSAFSLLRAGQLFRGRRQEQACASSRHSWPTTPDRFKFAICDLNSGFQFYCGLHCRAWGEGRGCELHRCLPWSIEVSIFLPLSLTHAMTNMYMNSFYRVNARRLEDRLQQLIHKYPLGQRLHREISKGSMVADCLFFLR